MIGMSFDFPYPDSARFLARRRQSERALRDAQQFASSTVDALPTHIAILTVVQDAQFPRRLLQSGALGYLTKGCPAEELVKAVRTVAQGNRYLDATVAREMALAAVDGDASPLESLSSREMEVALMLARGLAVNEVAARLHLSAKTVSTYKQRLFEKLGVEHTIALAHVLAAHGLLGEESASV